MAVRFVDRRIGGRETAPALILAVGLIAAVTSFAPGLIIEPERFAYPKELVFHLTALLAAAVVFSRTARLRVDRIDVVLAGFVLLAVLSSLHAVNPWAALRAASLTTSGALVFWTVRALEGEEHLAILLPAAALAVTLVALVSLMEAYGAIPTLSLPGRAPGGVFGNRNRMAHVLAAGLPIVAHQAATARNRLRVPTCWMGACTLIGAALTLSRARGAWLAIIFATVAAALLILRFRLAAEPAVNGRRALVVAGVILMGMTAAAWLPNRLDWKSTSPYADSWSHLVDAQSGSARARLVQQTNTLRMIADHPWLGTAPGNWMVAYPRYATRGDPSHNIRERVPVNRLPHGDWIGLAAERGIPAILLLAAFVVLTLSTAVRTLDTHPDHSVRIAHLAFVCTLITTGVAGVFDPVILTPAPMFIAALAAGVLARRTASVYTSQLTPNVRTVMLGFFLLAGVRPIVYGARQLRAGTLYANQPSTEALSEVVRYDPGNYLALLSLAEAWAAQGRCDLAILRAAAAFNLFPTALAPAEVIRGCRATLTSSGSVQANHTLFPADH